MSRQRPEIIVVTGANRGLGLGFTKLWLDQGRRVFALCRNPDGAAELSALGDQHGERLAVLGCDVADPSSVEAARRVVADRAGHVDAVVNNAGVYGAKEKQSELDALDDAELLRVFEVNALGPLRVTRSFLPLLTASSAPRLAHVTSLMGSIGDNGSGGNYAYRMSKAALNMANRNLGHELGAKGVPSVAIHPGWVATDMGGKSAPLTIEDSVSAMAATIDAIEAKHAGAFLDRHGEPLPW
jgi:NAD(P)-dependent dehydrogenase (short-subunit alcohol dehydrogenase family)